MSLEKEIRKIITPQIVAEQKECDICGDGSPCTCGESQEVQEALDDKVKGASDAHAGQAKTLEKEIEDDVKKESLDKTLEDLFQEGQIGEFDHLDEGYEAKVSKILNKKGIDHHWKNGKVYVSKRDEKSAEKILKKKAGPEMGTAVRMIPDIVGEGVEFNLYIEEEKMQEDKRFGLSKSLVDAVSKIIGGEKPEAVSPAQQAAIAIAKKEKGEKPKKEKDEDASNDKSDDGDGLDKADPKAAKKKFKDRKDKDIDNDGDVDSSDKFLHKKRKAIGKAMSKDEKKNGKKDTVDTKPTMDEEVDIEEGMLKVSDFDGKKHAEKAGIKVKMGASSPFGGASATLSGPDDKLIKYAVQHLGGSGKTLKDVQKSLNEAKMTDDQIKKREEIVMSLKKRMPEFEDKYGDKAKDVMYATATKMVMKGK